jgi:hypothetical protein
MRDNAVAVARLGPRAGCGVAAVRNSLLTPQACVATHGPALAHRRHGGLYSPSGHAFGRGRQLKRYLPPTAFARRLTGSTRDTWLRLPARGSPAGHCQRGQCELRGLLRQIPVDDWEASGAVEVVSSVYTVYANFRYATDTTIAVETRASDFIPELTE